MNTSAAAMSLQPVTNEIQITAILPTGMSNYTNMLLSTPLGQDLVQEIRKNVYRT